MRIKRIEISFAAFITGEFSKKVSQIRETKLRNLLTQQDFFPLWGECPKGKGGYNEEEELVNLILFWGQIPLRPSGTSPKRGGNHHTFSEF